MINGRFVSLPFGSCFVAQRHVLPRDIDYDFIGAVRIIEEWPNPSIRRQEESVVLCPVMKNQNTANAIHLQDLRVMSSDDEDCKFTTIGK